MFEWIKKELTRITGSRTVQLCYIEGAIGVITFGLDVLLTFEGFIGKSVYLFLFTVFSFAHRRLRLLTTKPLK